MHIQLKALILILGKTCGIRVGDILDTKETGLRFLFTVYMHTYYWPTSCMCLPTHCSVFMWAVIEKMLALQISQV